MVYSCQNIQTIFTIVGVAVTIIVALVGLFAQSNARQQQIEIERLSDRMDSLKISTNEQLKEIKQQIQIAKDSIPKSQ
ncbi:MAG TPA: hypothetical protein VFM99_07640 [Chitinophagales bacterium]|nr:hypothetical protein [Chitinophagales bacterium]